MFRAMPAAQAPLLMGHFITRCGAIAGTVAVPPLLQRSLAI